MPMISPRARLATARLGEGHRLSHALIDPDGLRERAPWIVQARAELADALASTRSGVTSVASKRVVLAVALRVDHQYDEAIREEAAALEVYREIHGEGSFGYLSVLVDFFELQAEAGRTGDALETVEQAIAAVERLPPSRSWMSAHELEDAAARALLRNGSIAHARDYAERAAQEPNRFVRLPYALTLAEVWSRDGNAVRSEQLTNRLWKVVHERDAPLAPVSTLGARVRLARGEARLQLGHIDAAIEDFRAALPDLLSTSPREHARAHLGLAAAAARMIDTRTSRAELGIATPLVAGLGAGDPLRGELAALTRRTE